MGVVVSAEPNYTASQPPKIATEQSYYTAQHSSVTTLLADKQQSVR